MRFIQFLVSLMLLSSSPVAFAQSPETYVAQYVKDVLSPLLPRIEADPQQHPFRMKTSQTEQGPVLSLEVLIPDPKKRRSEWNIYSSYKIHFVEGESYIAGPPDVRVHRFQSNKGEYLGPAIEGNLVAMFNSQKELLNVDDLKGFTRSLFRADQTLHPLFKNPLLPAQKNKKLTPPQLETLTGKKEGDYSRPGLVTMYQDHLKQGPTSPLHMLLMLPTGVGKTIVALKFLEMVKAIHQQQMPMMVFVVENKLILSDVAEKLQEIFPGEETARLFDTGTTTPIGASTRFILATRSTFFKRSQEILSVLENYSGPKVIYRDEAHHAGKVGGQFAVVHEQMMSRLSANTAVIDMSATPWHETQPEFIANYEGRVATAFISVEEYKNLIEGIEADRIARIQLVRAITEGWLAPLQELTFITGMNDNFEGLSFRQKLLREQQALTEKLGTHQDAFIRADVDDIPEEILKTLREEIRFVHTAIIEKVFNDLRAQFQRDRNERVAEYDRGIIFVPSIVHAEIYKIFLNDMAKRENMEFRVVHSRQQQNSSVDVVGQNIDWFNSAQNPHKHRYLISVDLLREGVDLPSANRLVYVNTSSNIKVLLQAFGRGTRLSQLKTGVRLTDFGGSFIRFFQEIPGHLLNTLFPVFHFDPKSNEPFRKYTDTQKSVITLDDQKVSINSLISLQVENPMLEIMERAQSDTKLINDLEFQKLKNAERDILSQSIKIETQFAWSVKVDPPTSTQINDWVQTILERADLHLDGRWSMTAEKRFEPKISSELSEFIFTNWKMLSLPWQYFLQDVQIERLFYDGLEHPMQRTYEAMMNDHSVRLGPESGIHRVYEAFVQGKTELFPESWSDTIKALTDFEKKQIVAVVNILALLNSSEGRRLVLAAPNAPSLLKMILQTDISTRTPYALPTYRHKTVPNFQLLGITNPWHYDYRWAESFEGTEDLLKLTRPSADVAKLRMQSLSVGLPFDGIHARNGKIPLFRLAAMARQLSLQNAGQKQFVAQFAQPLLDADITLGGNASPHRLTPQDGIFTLHRAYQGDSYIGSQVSSIELYMMKQAFAVEAVKNWGVPLPDERLNWFSKLATNLQPLPPLLLQDLIDQAPFAQRMIDPIEESHRQSLQAQLKLSDYTMTGDDLMDFDSRVMQDHGEDYLADKTSNVKLPKTVNAVWWLEYYRRIVYNPQLETLSIAQREKTLDIVSVLAEKLNYKRQAPAPWALTMKDWLLKPLSNDELPMDLSRISLDNANGMVFGTRIFTALPFYFLAKYGGHLEDVNGLGDVRSKEIVLWSEQFGQRYQQELQQLNLERLFYPSPEVMGILYQMQLNQSIESVKLYRTIYAHLVKPISGNAADIASAKKIETLIGGVLKIDHTYSTISIKTKERSIILDPAVFETLILRRIIMRVFFQRSGEPSKRNQKSMGPWDVLVDSLISSELKSVVERSRTGMTLQVTRPAPSVGTGLRCVDLF
jgi:superfamily II DNA or RNA helicase